MRVSLNTIKQYTDVDISVDELVAKINEQLGGVEEVIDLGERYKDAVIAKVVECKKHDNADKLSVCMIDAGLGDPVQVVCGAPNVREGLFVVWLPPQSTVPASFEDKEPFVLDARELRGVVSNGMLASAKELGIGDDHDGILEINPTEWKPSDVEIKPGTRFAEACGLDDTIIDIENKMFTHRPDLFGQLGVAREIAGIQHKAFTSPNWYKVLPEFNSGEGLELTVKNDASAVVPRFMTVAIKDVTVKPSPLWLRVELVRLGSKPINNIVDATNYIMLLTSQPTHAYDYDKLRGHTLGARMAMQGEKVTLLNRKTYELDETDIVIVDGEGPVGLAGVMGGGESEVSLQTKNIVLECANFDMYAVRKTSMRHGLFTDALTRFNKGQSSLQNPYVISLLMKSIFDVAGGEQASEVSGLEEPADGRKAVKVTSKFINERLGLSLSNSDIITLLENVEIHVDSPDDHDTYLEVYPSFWRTDIEVPEDIVEEVGRLYGFDKLPRELPERTMKPAPINGRLATKARIRDSLARAGSNEVLTYSFVHENTMKKAEQDVAQAFRLSNALSPDLQYYRLSVLPSLLDKVHANIKTGHDEFTLFEIGKGHNKLHHLDDDQGLPQELGFIDMVYASKKPLAGAAYYRVQRLVMQLAQDLGIGELVLKPITEPLDYPVTAPFDQARSAMVETPAGQFIGLVGELKQSVIKNFKLPAYTATATLDFDGIHQAVSATQASYSPLSRFPKVSQDISLKVGRDVSYKAVFQTVFDAVSSAEGGIRTSLKPIAIYQPDSGETKTITLRLEVVSYEKTLTDEDVTQLLDVAAQKAADQHGAARS
jgi:phenylalanyl-tRNA synthetase beta chain